MKKIIPFLLATFAFTACEKDADTDKLDNKFVVYTSYDKSANFKQFSTYYLPDSILIIGSNKTQEYWSDADAQKIIFGHMMFGNILLDGCSDVRQDVAAAVAGIGGDIPFVQKPAVFLENTEENR